VDAAYTGGSVAVVKTVIALTEKGLEKIDDIVCHFFRYIHLLKTDGPHEWFWKELGLINDIRIQQSDKTYSVTKISSLATKLLVS